MHDKVLVVLLGGSGHSTGTHTVAEIERELARRGWNHGMPAHWRLLHFDVARRPDPVSPGAPTSLGQTGRRVALTTPAPDYRDYVHGITRDAAMLPALVGCIDDPALERPLDKGAGQLSQLGYAVGVNQLDVIGRELDNDLNALASQDATSELMDVARHGGGDDRNLAPGITVIVVSSLCGGAGAGLLQLVVELIVGHATMGDRALRSELLTVLYTPDVFASLNATERDGVEANALHAVAALMNGYEATGRHPDALARLLARGGVVRTEGRRAAVTNLFVGAGNAALRHASPDAVFRATGRALARIITDPRIARELEAYLATNVKGAAAADDFRIADPAADSRPASALGHATVSLGNDTLAAYASERVAASGLDTVLHGHRALRRTADERDEATIERLVDELTPGFLADAGLGRDAVLDAIYPRATIREELRADVAAFHGELTRSTRKTAPSQWSTKIADHFDARGRRRADADADAQFAAARGWSAEVMRTLPDVAAGLVARYGIPVTVRVLDRARVAVREGAGELERERTERLLPLARQLREQGRALLGKVKERTLRSGDGRLAEAGKREGEGIFAATEASWWKAAAALLRDVDDAVLVPLRAAFANAGDALTKSTADGRDRALVERWSTGAIGPRLAPPPNELLLEPVASFPGRFEELLQRTVGVEGPANAVAAAAAEVVSGTWPRAGAADTGQRLIAVERAWHAGTGGAATFRIELDAPRLLADATTWVRERQGALAERVGLSIAEWVRGGAGRGDELADAFAQALRNAAPLVTVNGPVHARVHDRPPAPPAYLVGTVPIADDPRSPVSARIVESLRAAGLSDGRIASLFDPTSPAETIEITSFLGQPVHPVVLSSLFEPIQRDRQTRTNAGRRQEFTRHRRTRPLPLFVPLSAGRIDRFARGWIAAELLGRLDPLAGRWSDRPPTVWTPRGRLALPPFVLGDDVEEPRERLAAALLSLPLALASYASQQYDELEAYMRILDLGDLRALRTWVETGATERAEPGAEAAPVPPADVAGRAEDGPEERRTAVLATVGQTEADLAGWLDARPLTAGTLSTLTPAWEAGPLTLAACAAVRTALAPVEPSSNGRVETVAPEAVR